MSQIAAHALFRVFISVKEKVSHSLPTGGQLPFRNPFFEGDVFPAHPLYVFPFPYPLVS